MMQITYQEMGVQEIANLKKGIPAQESEQEGVTVLKLVEMAGEC